jgi:glutaredoxin-like protein
VRTSITMYSADWCGDCVRSKRLLDSLQVSYEIIDVESVPGASEKVIEINGGNRSIPVILFPDGTHLTEPSDIDLKAKLEALKII